MATGSGHYQMAPWCDLCDAPHEPCEPPDLTFECLLCNAPMPDDAGPDDLCVDCKNPAT